MRYCEVAGGLRIPVSSEENTLVEKIRKGGTMEKKKLDEREREVARKLVSRGVLNRKCADDGIKYEVNDLQDVWR